MAEKKIQGSITLVTVEDGAPGQNGAPGTSTYTYVRYAEDDNGTNISETPTETSKYIGIITTTSPTAPSTGYTWALFKGQDGQNGAEGKSAYQLWLEAGNSGSEQDYLNSLKGEKGEDGTAESYIVQTNVEEINKFFGDDTSNLLLSPERISFKVLKENEVIIPKEDYLYEIALLYDENIGSLDLADLVTFFEEIDNDENSYGAYVYINDNKVSIKLLEEVLFITETQEVVLDLRTLINCELHEKSSYLAKFNLLKQIIKQEISVFNFKVYQNDESKKLITYKTINCEFGLPEEMAKFKLTATQIQAAVDNANLIFSAEGLEIVNGGLKIIKTDEENEKQELLYFSDGNLYIDGHGTFSGEIFAESGRFSGEIRAVSGNIGGFIIEDNILYSSDKEYREENTFVFDESLTYYEKVDEEYNQTTDKYLSIEKEYYTLAEGNYFLVTTAQFLSGRIYFELDENGNYIEVPDNEKANLNKKYYYIASSIALFGEQNKIIANNIELGAGAKILNYIELGEGEAYIYNPSENNGLFLSTGGQKIQLNAKEETLTLGDITLNGKTSSISGAGFDIRPGFSSFDNVRVSGEIITSIFTKGSTQTVGGAMLFKAAYKIENQEEGQSQGNITFTLNKDILDIFPDEVEDPSGEDARYVTLIAKDGSLSNKYFRITKDDFSENEENETVHIDLAANSNTYNTLIVLGKNNDIIIGVNSENNRSALLEPRGLTISQLNITDTKLSTDLKVFLGDLTNLGLNLSGYGLYSNNVYLTGSLITDLSGGEYAGVNTLNGVNANKFGDGDKSNIVFWAGSQGTNDEAIKNAKFQVTQNGSIYASQGFFEDSVIARSRITGADIYAARLHGVELDKEGNPKETVGALTIYDTDKGIVFKTGFKINGNEIDEGKETFSIGVDGLKVEDEYFIGINNKKASFYGNYGEIASIQTGSINIGSLGAISLISNTETLAREATEENTIQILKRIDKDNKSSLELTDNSYYFKVFGTNTSYIMKVNQQQSEINTTQLKIKENLMVGDKDTNIEYKKVSGGYDLYVYGSITP